MEIRHSLADENVLPCRTNGAALSADLSGFTRLANALADELGVSRGAEQLASMMERTFEGIVACVHRYSGSVVGFSGDAITCWFDESVAGGKAIERGVTAGADMLAYINAMEPIVTPTGRRFTIKVRVAISSGSASRFIVGDPRIQRFEILGGETVTRMALASELASAGQMVVAEEVKKHLGSSAEFSRAIKNSKKSAFYQLIELKVPAEISPWSAPAEIDEVTLNEWVVDSVATRLSASHAMVMGSYKPITALFLQFEGIDYDVDEDAGERLDHLICTVQRLANRHKGMLMDITIGDKGNYLFIAFGALQAQEQSVLQALETTAQLRQAARPVSVLQGASIGISQGSVYSGLYGCEQRRTFGVVGNEVVLAARLMSRASPGQNLVTPRIAEVGADKYVFEASESAIFKGNDEAVGFFQFDPTALRQGDFNEKALVRDPLIGRDKVKSLISARLSALQNGDSGILFVEGEAGIGKSRLVGFVLQQAKQKDLRCVPGFADPIKRAVRLYAWTGIFERLLGLDFSDEPEPLLGSERLAQRSEQVTSYLEMHLSEKAHLAPLLNEILQLQIVENTLTENMVGEVRAFNTLDLLADIIRFEASDSALLIVLEDAHWFDSASAALLVRLSEGIDNLLLLVTRRVIHEDVAANAVYQIDTSEGQLIALGSLEVDEVGALLCSALDVDAIAPELRDFIVEKGEGSPFFSRELGYALRAANLIQISGGMCVLAPDVTDLNKADFPMTIQGVIASRIDQLDADQQLTIKVASVIGRRFGRSIVHDIYPVSTGERPDVQRNLQLLEAAEILAEDTESEENDYLFRHILSQEVAYSLILHKHRVGLHEKAARWYEGRAGKVSDANISVLAYHWSRSLDDDEKRVEVVDKALDYLGRAAEQALNNYSIWEANRYFGEALSIDAGRPRDQDDGKGGAASVLAKQQRVRWHAGLAYTLNALGESALCEASVIKGLAEAGAPMPSSTLRFLSGTLRQMGSQAYTRYLQNDTIRVDPEKRATLSEEYRLLHSYSHSLWGSNESLKMLYANFRNLNTLEKLGPSGELAVIHSHMLLTMDVFKRPKWSAWYGARSLAMARSEGQLTELVAVLVCHGLHHVSMGRWPKTDEVLEEAKSTALSLGDKNQFADATSVQADAAIFRGDISKALALSLSVYSGGERQGTLGQMALSLRTQAIKYLRDDNRHEALLLLQRAQAVLATTNEKLIQIDVSGLVSELQMQASEIESAYEGVKKALLLVREVMPAGAYPRYFGFQSIATVLFTLLESPDVCRDARIDPKEVLILAKKHVKDYGQYSDIFPIALPCRWMFSAWLAALSGKKQAAKAQLQKSLEAAVSLNMPFEMASTHALITRLMTSGQLPGSAADRSLHESEARRLFASINSVYHLKLFEKQMLLAQSA